MDPRCQVSHERLSELERRIIALEGEARGFETRVRSMFHERDERILFRIVIAVNVIFALLVFGMGTGLLPKILLGIAGAE